MVRSQQFDVKDVNQFLREIKNIRNAAKVKCGFEGHVLSDDFDMPNLRLWVCKESKALTVL